MAYYAQFSLKEHEDIRSRADLMASCLEKYSEDSILGILHNAYDGAADLRVTLVDGGGSVLYDNTGDVPSMDNHMERPEIVEAFEKGFGAGSRNRARRAGGYIITP